LRDNLDPMGESDTETIKDVMRMVQLDDENMNLDGPLVQLSHGEKNLVAVARALLRQTKVLIEDEATASVDTHTDAIIQRVMRKQHCTRAVIAHRLNSVIECDKVLVMNNGRVEEIDVPSSLLLNHSSYFRGLVMATGEQSSRHLVHLASVAKVRTEADPMDSFYRGIESDFDLFSVKF
jgi:ATP-binding cassette subfamily C (CFTR/MRP) protein 1